MNENWLKKAAMLVVPLFTGFLFVVAAIALRESLIEPAGFIALAFFLALVYGSHRLFVALYLQVLHSEVQSSRDPRFSESWKYYFYAWATFSVILGALSDAEPVYGSLGMYGAAAYFMFLVWRCRRMDLAISMAHRQVMVSPPEIRQELEEEIDAWRIAGLLDEEPMVGEVLELSNLVVAEGEEDIEDRPAIEAFFAESMRDLIADLTILRKLLRGETFLTETQKQNIDRLKSNIERHKVGLQTLYQSIAG